MSDIADIAVIEIENALNQQISNFRQKINRVGISSPVCAICGEVIPSARQKAVPRLPSLFRLSGRKGKKCQPVTKNYTKI